MSKRFSETDKWKDEWFSALSPIEKLTFLFLLDNCDQAGFFELNPRMNAFLIGISEEDYLGAIKGLNRGLLGAKSGSKMWIENFLFHQKNLPLNPLNNAHKHIISILTQNMHLFEHDFSDLGVDLGVKLAPNEGLISPIGKGIGKGLLIKEKELQEIDKKGFGEFWDLYDKKVGDKPKCMKKWLMLSDIDHQKIMETLPAFLSAIKDKQFQPFPETYLNQKRWLDEIVKSPVVNGYPGFISRVTEEEKKW